MESTKEQIKELQQQVEALAAEQELLRQKITAIAKNLNQISAEEPIKEVQKNLHQNVMPEPARIFTTPNQHSGFTRITPVEKKSGWYERNIFNTQGSRIDFEKFIGENIISKIGILITVIGVGIGTKYAIDNNLISPLTRILLGYLLGIIFFAFAIRIRNKYENFSAVIISGAMAIFYLTTFAAYNFFALIPQLAAFGLMVLLTAVTVGAALRYNRQWIALLGLVGAYAIPFLLSDGSGRVQIMFTYMALLNIGILAVAIKKYWTQLYYAAFGISWIIFLSWFAFKFDNQHFGIAILFATVFFFIFYAVFLVHKLIEKRIFASADVFILLLNAFIYFGIGLFAFEDNSSYSTDSGLFTIANALIHGLVAYAVYRSPSYDRNLFYLLSGLVLVFITVAIPVQLDGNWVTLFWAMEAALLFYIGRTKNVAFYEKLSYPLMVFSLISQIQDWNGLGMPYMIQSESDAITPLLNLDFGLTFLVIAAFGYLTFISAKNRPNKINVTSHTPPYIHFFGTILPPAAFIFLLYFTFRLELIHFWNLKYEQQLFSNNSISETTISLLAPNTSTILKLWILNYTICFAAFIGIINLRAIKTKVLSDAFVVGSMLTIVVFLLSGMEWLGQLRDEFLNKNSSTASISKFTAFSLRYFSYACIALLLGALHFYQSKVYSGRSIANPIFDLMLHITLLVIGSSELITWLKYYGVDQFDKLGLSIFWGFYALILIGLGIFLQRQHLRIGAIVLFSVTLIKLFFYDIASMNTMTKTVVFILLGLLLLTISFLYVKYKGSIGEKGEE